MTCAELSRHGGSNPLCIANKETFKVNKISQHGKDEIAIISKKAAMFPDIEAIYLFGSCAKNLDTPESDIDTLILWKDSEEFNESTGLEIHKFISEVFKEKEFRWDRLFLNDTDSLNNHNYGVYNEIKQLNKVIYRRGK